MKNEKIYNSILTILGISSIGVVTYIILKNKNDEENKIKVKEKKLDIFDELNNIDTNDSNNTIDEEMQIKKQQATNDDYSDMGYSSGGGGYYTPTYNTSNQNSIPTSNIPIITIPSTTIISHPIATKLPSSDYTIKPTPTPSLIMPKPKPSPTPSLIMPKPKPSPAPRQINTNPTLKPLRPKPINTISIAFNGDDLSKKFNH